MRPAAGAGSTRWTAALLLLLTWSVSASLSGVAHGLEGTSSTLTVATALTLGWALARSGQPGAHAGGLAGLVGLGVIALRIGQLGDEYLRLAGSVGSAIVGPLFLGAPLSAAPVLQAFEAVLAGYGVLITRTWDWSTALLAGQPAVDPVASALTWSASLWSVAYWAAWWTWRRARPLIAALPAIALLGASLYLSRSSHVYLLLPLAATLVLLAFSGHEARQRRWEADRLARSEGMLGPLTLSAVSVSFALVIAAALAPQISIDRLLEFGRGRPVVVEGGLRESLGLSPGSRPGTGFDPVLIPGLPNRQLIGAGPELSERTVMTVTVLDPQFAAPAPRYYWRALTYDRYNGRGWQTSSLAVQAFDAGDELVSELRPGERVVRQRVQAVGELGGLVYSAGRLATVDQEFELAWREIARDPFAATLTADAYWVESVLPQFGQAELRAAGADYPDWVMERYLTLPPEVPQRVRRLARELTATAATPYDRAVAIESYLRAFPYTLEVPAPPGDQDVVDYFLFELQRGYCDYYASTMVVLARAAGLPARLVVGYFTGAPQPTEGTVRYLVSEAEAHSWVELYFPGIGWVEFEPTGGRPAIERPSHASQADPESEPPSLRLSQELRNQRWTALRDSALGVTAVAGLAGLAGGLAWWALDARRLRRTPPPQAIAELYHRLFASVGRLTSPLAPSLTPHELLAAYLERSAASDRPASLLRPVVKQARSVVALHVAAAYGPTPADAGNGSEALRAWQRLGPRLWLARLLAQL